MSTTNAAIGSIVTFYSYKGGVGRTMVLANVGLVLSTWGYRVLLVDWDLEAPGLGEYLRPLIELPLQGGVVDLLGDDSDDEGDRWKKFTTHVITPGQDAALDFLAAGGSVGDYPERVQRLDLPNLYAMHGLGRRLERLRDAWKTEYDFVLLDSRTGISDVGGVCTVQLPDILCLCFTTNRQSFYGALDVAGRADRQRHDVALDRARLLVLPLVTKFESSVEFSLAQMWEREFADNVGELVADWMPEDVTAGELMPHLRVPYVPHWSFGEQLPALDDDPSDPLTVAYAVETIAALIARRGADTGLLVQNRQLYVEGADRSGIAGRRRASLFTADFALVNDPRDSLYATQLMSALREMGLKVVPARGQATTQDDDDSAAAQHMILVVGEHTSPQLQTEYRRFVLDLVSEESSRVLIPLVHAPGGAQRLPVWLRSFQWVDAWDRPLAEVVAEIAERVGRKPPSTPATPALTVDLDSWFNESDEAFQSLVLGTSFEDRYAHGVWKVGYGLAPQPDLNLGQLREAIRTSAGSETGWPEWMWADFEDARPRIVNDVIECWLATPNPPFQGGSHSDYWRGSPKGLMYLLRGYEDDDEPRKRPPGTTFDLTLPIWRTAEAFLHATRMAEEVGLPDARIRLRGVWTGLKGRRLASWAQPSRDLFATPRQSSQDSIQREVALLAADVRENLSQAVFELLKDVYALFDFFELPFGLVEEEVGRFRSSRSR
jgi:MinD-like ATPase involved in chromosome partitioning or flagellar assembly